MNIDGKGQKPNRKFEAKGETVVGPTLVVRNVSSARAKKIATALNRVLRIETFKPKNAGRRARTKGHSFEREVAIRLREVFPKARRHLEYQDAEANGVDLIETGEFRIQCKRLRDYSPINKIDEVTYDEALGEIPVLVTAADGKPAMAVLSLTELIRLIKLSRRKDDFYDELS